MNGEDMKFLSNIMLLKDLNDTEITLFSKILKPLKFKDGDTIITENEEGDTLFIFREGTVQVSSQITLKMGSNKWSEAEKSMAILDAGKMNFFGEMSLITGAPRSATIKALTPCVLFEVTREEFDQLAETYPAIGYKIMKQIAATLSNRIKQTNGNILKLTTALSIALSKKKKK